MAGDSGERMEEELKYQPKDNHGHGTIELGCRLCLEDLLKEAAYFYGEVAALRAELTKEREQHFGTLKEFDEFRTNVGHEFARWKLDREKVLSQSRQIGELVEALKKISGMERMTFAECTDAEFIMDTANEAIRSVEQGK